MDTGNARAGVWWDDEEAVEIVKYIQQQCGNVKFQGVYVHCGNSYTAQTVAQVQGVRNSAMDCVLSLVASLQKEGLQCPTWGIGSTPSCSHNTDKVAAVQDMELTALLSLLCFSSKRWKKSTQGTMSCMTTSKYSLAHVEMPI